MKNHFSKMGKVLLGATLLSTVNFTSCSDDDFHLKDYEDNAPSFLGQSLYHELSRRGNFQTVVKLIEDLEYAEVLSKTGSKTMFVAPDSAWEEFFRNNSWGVSSYEELSKNQKRVLLNNSMLNNAYVMEMLANTEDGGKNLCLRQITSASALPVLFLPARWPDPVQLLPVPFPVPAVPQLVPVSRFPGSPGPSAEFLPLNNLLPAAG
ncbi:MAG: hypothetical protein II200_04810 [Bacteroidaceae bacterium]|nr:hypothetical protein [Bacteroidaceae bacterium]